MNKTTIKMLAMAAVVVWASNRIGPVRAFIGP